MLLTTDDAVSLWEKIENLEGRVALERQRCSEKLSVENERCFKQMVVAKDAADSKIEILKTAFAACEAEKQREWWESPTLLLGAGAVTGLVVGVAATAGAVWLGAQARVVVE